MLNNLISDFVIFYTFPTKGIKVSDSLEKQPVLSALAMTLIISSFVLML